MRLLWGAAVLGGGLLIGATTWVAFRHGVMSSETGLPVLGTVPPFSLVRSSGAPLSHADLAGEVWVADFIYTRCGSLCPLLSAQMAKLQSALAQHAGGAAVRLVSFSVDPLNDTPAALRAYATRFRADERRWFFLTGERSALHRLVADGFHLAVAERSPAEDTDGEGLITHSDRFVLVDRHLQIRGYYHGTDESAIQQLLHDIDALRGQS